MTVSVCESMKILFVNAFITTSYSYMDTMPDNKTPFQNIGTKMVSS